MLVQRLRKDGSAPSDNSWRAKLAALSASPAIRCDSHISSHVTYHKCFTNDLSLSFLLKHKIKEIFLIVSIQYEYTLTYSRSSCLAAVVKQSHVSKTISVIDTTASLQNLQNKANLIWMDTEQGHPAKDFMLTETHTLPRKIILQFTELDTKRRVGERVGMFYDSCKKTWN